MERKRKYIKKKRGKKIRRSTQTQAEAQA